MDCGATFAAKRGPHWRWLHVCIQEWYEQTSVVVLLVVCLCGRRYCGVLILNSSRKHYYQLWKWVFIDILFNNLFFASDSPLSPFELLSALSSHWGDEILHSPSLRCIYYQIVISWSANIVKYSPVSLCSLSVCVIAGYLSLTLLCAFSLCAICQFFLPPSQYCVR